MITPAGKFFGQDTSTQTPQEILQSKESKANYAMTDYIYTLTRDNVIDILANLIAKYKEENPEFVDYMKRVFGVDVPQQTPQEIIITVVLDKLIALKVKDRETLKERLDNIKKLPLNNFGEQIKEIIDDIQMDKKEKRNLKNKITNMMAKGD